MIHECCGCTHWKWHPKDQLYNTPGYHRCDEPDICERFQKIRIQRDSAGFIMEECLQDMRDSLPIGMFVNIDNTPCRIIRTTEELEDYLFGAIPYAITTYYRKDDKK